MLTKIGFVAYMILILSCGVASWCSNYFLFLAWCITTPGLALYFILKENYQYKKFGRLPGTSLVGSEMNTMYQFSSIFFASMMCLIMSFFLS